MIPIGDEENGRILTPFVNLTLIAINVLVFLFQLTLPDSPRDPALQEFVFRWGAIPDQVTQGRHLETLLTSMFLHGGWLHIAGNMLFLWVFGDNVEDTMGHVRYLLFYLLCGIAAALAQILLSPASEVPLVGASGAISGVLGAYIVLFPHGRIRTLVFLGFFVSIVLVPAWVQIGLWIVLQFVSGVVTFSQLDEQTGGVAFWAHVGGFVAGAALVWLFKDRDAVDRQRAVRSRNHAWERVGWSGR